MKQAIILTAILMLAACGNPTEEAVLRQQRATSSITAAQYVYDPRTDLCFLVTLGYGGLANVPCTPKVMEQIRGKYVPYQ